MGLKVMRGRGEGGMSGCGGPGPGAPEDVNVAVRGSTICRYTSSSEMLRHRALRRFQSRLLTPVGHFWDLNTDTATGNEEARRFFSVSYGTCSSLSSAKDIL